MTPRKKLNYSITCQNQSDRMSLSFKWKGAIEQYELQTDQRCRDLDEEEDDWLEDEEREPALLLCHLFRPSGIWNR